MISYAFKRVSRNWKFFTALIVGILISTTLFTGINVGSDIIAMEALNDTLKDAKVDILANVYKNMNSSSIVDLKEEMRGLEYVREVEPIFRKVYSMDNYSYPLTLFSLMENSSFLKGLDVVEGKDTLGPNEAWVEIGSMDLGLLKIGDNVTIDVGIYWNDGTIKRMKLTLRIVGYVHLPNDVLEASLGYFISPSVISGYLRNLKYNLLVVNLNETVLPTLDKLYELKKSSEVSILLKPITLAIFLEREEIASIYDVDYFLEKLLDLEYKLNLMLSPYDGNLFNYIRMVVEGYRNFAMSLNFSFMISSLPVLLIAVVSTKTAAEISFNLRRREIGLLFVKGFKRRSVFIMFLLEAIFIGIVTSFLGLLLGGFIIPYLVIPEFDPSLSISHASADLIVLTIFVGLAFALISTFSPAIKASKLKVIDALKEYV
ncbi:MAG: FtsX-like permease family protein, partial [Candidatus Odinarchaeota archaeon]|nr:FtsX-like permease family protein [Candidatus Odinarchaeota archaeon]